jgi:hypothetical protein
LYLFSILVSSAFIHCGVLKELTSFRNCLKITVQAVVFELIEQSHHNENRHHADG